MVTREYKGRTIDIAEMLNNLNLLEKQYQDAKAEYKHLGSTLKTKRYERLLGSI